MSATSSEPTTHPWRQKVLKRMLYLAWLKVISMDDPEEVEGDFEPPVPTGLKKLNASLQAFAEFFEIIPHLIAAAAAASKNAGSSPEPDLESAIAKLTRAETDTHLLQIVRGGPGAVLSLKKHLGQLSGGKPPSQSRSMRTACELFEQAEKIEMAANRKAREEAEPKRIQKLDKLLKQKRGTTYDEATKLLVELHDMSEYKQRKNKFIERFWYIRERYRKNTALLERFRRTGLL